MPKARMPKRRVAMLTAAGLLIGTCAAVAVAGPSDHDGGAAAGTAQAAAPAADGTAVAASPTGEAAPSPSASASGSASASASASATPSGSPTGARPPSAAPSGASQVPAAPAARTDTSPVFTGLAFDTCTAPALSVMTAWHGTSPYGAAAVYIGGRNRGCAQPQLTAGWVKAVTAGGWRLIPLYVGAQAPCQSGAGPYRIDAANPGPQGTADGQDAVAKAGALGMRAGGAIYLDVEAYNASDAACGQAVVGYVQGFTRALRQAGYTAGFYGYASSSAAGIAKAVEQRTPDLPDAVWYAKYDGVADTTSSFPFGAGLWSGHRRGHQYVVNQKETYGGSALTVDRDAWDGPVAVIG
ncbi:DUF1906 domain-containing protein [Kitasatospora terrestris]|uniref:Rv2525c-like glycoside hydrolase-like domain-containing protein n=1 Tax=Kitasatospora terrestris TaxID=258051 RepID=A0ABP9E9Z2_9ACTN